MSKLPIFEHFPSVGNVKPNFEWFFKPKLKPKLCLLNWAPVQAVYMVNICPSGNLPYIRPCPVNNAISTLNNTKFTHHKSTLNPDLPYNRLPYKRFLLYLCCHRPRPRRWCRSCWSRRRGSLRRCPGAKFNGNILAWFLAWDSLHKVNVQKRVV